jgi:hypothetical protein
MRVSTLLEWGVIFVIFLVAVLGIQSLMGGTAAPAINGLSPADPGTSHSSPDCSGLGLGGFYQEPLSAPRTFRKQISDWTFTIQPVYQYRIVGKIVGKDEYLTVPTDLLAPMDLMIANGEVISPEQFRYFTFQKLPRHYRFSYFPQKGVSQPSEQYMKEHVSNNHLIFADESVYARAKAAVTGDFVVISGYLVTVSGKSGGGGTFTQGTSTTRSDLGEGSCEVVYVESFEKKQC